MRLTAILSGFLVTITLFLGLADARADDSGWLVGHWQGHDTKNAADKRPFVLDVAAINADQSFVALWSIAGQQSRGQGKVDGNAVTITFANGNSISLFRASDGSLAGSNANTNGAPGITFVFAKSAAAATANAAPAAPGGGGEGCVYHPIGTGTSGTTLHAQEGDQVVTRLGVLRCINGKLQKPN